MTLITDANENGVYYALSHTDKVEFHVTVDGCDGRGGFTLHFNDLESALANIKGYGDDLYQEFVEGIID